MPATVSPASTSRPLFRLGLLALVLAAAGLFAAGAKTARPVDELQVLFIGNSFTYYHDLPKMVAELARAGGQRPLSYQSETPGGCTLEKHWTDGRALELIRSRRWDVVVLQDQSQIPLTNRPSMFRYAKKFAAEIERQRAKTAVYMTWAQQDKPQQQPTISKAYEDLAGELRALVMPVGNAWQTALAAEKTRVLHDPDKRHPNPAGSYLAACVFYGTIYGVSPEGLPGDIAGLSDREARALQTIAWKAVQAAER